MDLKMKSRGELFGEKGGGWRETERRPLLFSGDFALFHGLKKKEKRKKITERVSFKRHRKF
jgi:hypothetical protein